MKILKVLFTMGYGLWAMGWSGLWANEPINIEANTVTYHLEDGTITFAGDVTVQQAGRTLTAARLTATLDDTGSLSTLTATGGVTVTQPGPPTETATSNQAVYNLTRNTLTLTGDATLTRGDNRLTGEELIYDLTAGTVNLAPATGERIRAELQPTE